MAAFPYQANKQDNSSLSRSVQKMKIPIYKGSVDNKDDEVRLSCSDVKICDRVEMQNDQKF